MIELYWLSLLYITFTRHYEQLKKYQAESERPMLGLHSTKWDICSKANTKVRFLVLFSVIWFVLLSRSMNTYWNQLKWKELKHINLFKFSNGWVKNRRWLKLWKTQTLEHKWQQILQSILLGKVLGKRWLKNVDLVWCKHLWICIKTKGKPIKH